jgi:GAF domain-containing protein
MTNIRPFPKNDMPSEEPIKALILCPNCNVEMCLYGLEAESDARDLYTFECRACDVIEVRGVRVNKTPTVIIVAPIAEVRKNLDGPDDILQLHEISTLLVQEGNLAPLYNRILDVAMNLMSSDMASMQLLDPKSNQLHLLAWKGFHPQSATFWERVQFNSACTCGIAFSTGSRVVVSDTETCEFMAGTPDLDEYRRSNIRAVQSTPLLSRSGQLLGMISTHWREPHRPTEPALRRLDVLARQAADLIERGTACAAQK